MINKKFIALLMTLLLVLSLTPVVNADEHESTYTIDLLAGQDMDVGDVIVSNDGKNITVKYEIHEEDWVMTEAHLSIVTKVEDFPINKSGNPIPGHFTLSEEYDPGVISDTFTKSLSELGVECEKEVYIAAHAVVYKPEVTETNKHTIEILSNTDGTKYLASEDPDIWEPAVAAWVHPAWKNYPDTNDLLNDGALWIWESEYVQHPIEGDIVEFKHDFNIVGEPTSAELTITADNAYAYKVNSGEETESASLFGDWRNSNLTDDFVSPIVGTWTTTEKYNVLSDLNSVSNTLFVTGVNEYQGELDNESAGTFTSNPGAVIYKLVIESEEVIIITPPMEETAWGDGDRFVERGNWATYFKYDLECPEEEFVETVIVPSDGTKVYSTNILENGQVYRLEANGYYTYNNQFDWADAEYYLKNEVIVKGDSEGSVPYVLDVSVDGAPINDDWGEYSSDHIYSMEFTGTGDLLEFYIYDSYYQDNEGNITVKIYKVH